MFIVAVVGRCGACLVFVSTSVTGLCIDWRLLLRGSVWRYRSVGLVCSLVAARF